MFIVGCRVPVEVMRMAIRTTGRSMHKFVDDDLVYANHRGTTPQDYMLMAVGHTDVSNVLTWNHFLQLPLVIAPYGSEAPYLYGRWRWCSLGRG